MKEQLNGLFTEAQIFYDMLFHMQCFYPPQTHLTNITLNVIMIKYI